ncbi:hypothetical protein ZOSMA_129G00350 [Zostera marina]|uniref:F-box domain-containing protein n=1 Tax=Zostera marina TaxID=29655 RepID=A0A0K9Q1M9_ZOSMR|nr:hypothetical protein ZOSMA_129G00350 [Zostera marina]
MEGASRDGSEMFNSLPEDCISHIFSLTSPRDACCFAALSRHSRSLADSDLVWVQFIPSKYEITLSRAVTPVHFSSKKDLFFRLCVPIIIDDGENSFAMDESTGKQNYMISSKVVTPILYPHHYITLPESRFPNVLVVKDYSEEFSNEVLLFYNTMLKCVELSEKTTYVVHLIYKLDFETLSRDRQYAYLGSSKLAFSDDAVFNFSCLISKEDSLKIYSDGDHEFLRNYIRMESSSYFAKEREGCGQWMEVALGEFFNEIVAGKEEVFLDFTYYMLTSCSLIIEGIEFRVKESNSVDGSCHGGVLQ